MKALAPLSKKLGSSISRFARDEEAATAAEYGIIAALIAAVIVVAVSSLGTSIKSLFTNLAKTVNSGASQG